MYILMQMVVVVAYHQGLLRGQTLFGCLVAPSLVGMVVLLLDTPHLVAVLTQVIGVVKNLRLEELMVVIHLLQPTIIHYM